jgi:23S rRNA (adenine2503-C2)-methyltransferase
MLDFRSLTFENLQTLFKELGEESYRAIQVYKWIHKGIDNFSEMTDLSQELRERLAKIGYIRNIQIFKQIVSADGNIKFLNLLNDSNIIESVLMKYHHGFTLCLSTQVGCKMKCQFCASGKEGFIKNLSAGEMLGQILEAQKILKRKVNNIVIMGSGEPLDNLDALLKFIDIINNLYGINISERNITISTCGLIPQIKLLADKKLKITLALSLHNPFQEEREHIMPIAKKYTIPELMHAIDYYINMTKRRVTIEYMVISGLNDTKRHASELGKLLQGKLIHVNIIPINKIKNTKYSQSSPEKIGTFIEILKKRYNIITTVRRTIGSDINAACGQLRNSYLNGMST